MRIYLEPDFGSAPDEGDGGVRRVVEALQKHLPLLGVEIVSSPSQADIIHSHIAPTSITERLLRTHPDIPFVVSSHGQYWLEYEWPNWALKANAQCMEAIRWADHVIAPSEWVAQAIRRNSLRPTTAIYHGIDLEDWPLSTDKEDYVLWNKTRIDAVCDPEPIEKLARMRQDVPFVSTFSKGNASIKNLVLTGRLGYVEAKQLVQKAVIYLCTSRETFGIGTLEAMATGCPILGWNWGGQREIIEHKKTGWLSTPGDYKDLAEGLDYCLQHCEEMGQAARVAVTEHFQWKQIIPEYIKIYQLLLKQKHRDAPTVSIIVPAYKLEEFLPESLDSVLAQSYTDWECIIVDDASPDRCGEIAESYAINDNRFKVVHNEINQYLAGALNVGIAQAKGRYILPLDADNVLPPHAVELLTTALENDRSLHIAYGNVEFLEPNGKRWHSGWPPQFRAEWQIKRSEDQARPNNLIPSGSMFRRQVWELTGGYRKRWKTAEDADFWTRATSYGFRAAMVTEADVLIYRNRTESMSRQHSAMDWSSWYPWSRELAAAPAAIPYTEQVPIPSYEPILISVIIPVGSGHEELCIDAIDSVDAQTFRLWECIVINDSGKKLPLLPNWVKVVSTRGKTKGVARARNLGLQHAKAKLFIPLDADDTLEPEALAKMYDVWQRHNGYVYTDWYERWEGRELKVWQTPDYDAHLLIKKGCLHAVTALYPIEMGGFDEEIPAWEDWDYQLRLASKGICGTRIPEPLFTYRKDTGQRREENYAQFEISKQGILKKWGPYFNGQEELMGCRSCPGGGGKKSSPTAQPKVLRQAVAAAPPIPESEDFLLVEYTGAREGTLSYRGPTGQMYRFSAYERQKMVHPRDLNYFLSFGEFRLIEKEAPIGVPN